MGLCLRCRCGRRAASADRPSQPTRCGAAPRRSIAGTVFHAPCSMLLQRCHRVVATLAPGPCRRRRPTPPPRGLRLMAVTALSASPCCFAAGVGRDFSCRRPTHGARNLSHGRKLCRTESAGSAAPAPRQPSPVRRGAASDRAHDRQTRGRRLPSQTPLPGRGVPLLEEDASAPRARAPLQPGL